MWHPKYNSNYAIVYVFASRSKLSSILEKVLKIYSLYFWLDWWAIKNSKHVSQKHDFLNHAEIINNVSKPTDFKKSVRPLTKILVHPFSADRYHSAIRSFCHTTWYGGQIQKRSPILFSPNFTSILKFSAKKFFDSRSYFFSRRMVWAHTSVLNPVLFLHHALQCFKKF